MNSEKLKTKSEKQYENVLKQPTARLQDCKTAKPQNRRTAEQPSAFSLIVYSLTASNLKPQTFNF
jgi:hypothetical protein